jgi:hypothetical protein
MILKKIFLLVVLVASLGACNNETESSKVTLSGEDKKVAMHAADSISKDPSITTSIQWLDSTFLDLGDVNDGKKVEVSFRFKNTGDKPLVISNVSASCGCTVPEKPERPFAPGEEGVIKANFDSKGRHGENIKHVTVTANTSPATSHELGFRVRVQ